MKNKKLKINHSISGNTNYFPVKEVQGPFSLTNEKLIGVPWTTGPRDRMFIFYFHLFVLFPLSLGVVVFYFPDINYSISNRSVGIKDTPKERKGKKTPQAMEKKQETNGSILDSEPFIISCFISIFIS